MRLFDAPELQPPVLFVTQSIILVYLSYTPLKNSIQIADDVQIKVVIDCGNGAAGCIAPKLFKELGCEVVELFTEVDGNFPNHHPDPGNDPRHDPDPGPGNGSDARG